MPGNIDLLDTDWARGWATHPAHAGYSMTVHAIDRGRVIATVLADLPREDGMPGFALPLGPAVDRRHLQVLLGETDEVLSHPAPAEDDTGRMLTVEDLIATPARRGWVNGACYLDAAAAGLQPETIIDLLCRDHLGRPAGPVVTATALAKLQSGGYDDVRRMLLQSGEYKYRRIYADAAPGAIFSQSMVLSVAGDDFTTGPQRTANVTQVSALPLLDLEDEAFVTACYRQILRKDPDRAGMSHYLRQLAAGVSRPSIIRYLGNEFETISAGIVIVDLPMEN